MEQSEPVSLNRKRRWSWAIWAVLFLAWTVVVALFGSHAIPRRSQECLAPPFPPVSLEIVYGGESEELIDDNIFQYSGTAHYTFRNRWPFPVTLAFPPIVSYTSGENSQQGLPFPNKERSLPEFAKEQREVVIPAGESITFSSDFNHICNKNHFPKMYRAFVFGPPQSPCENPVLGTIYGAVEYMESPRNSTGKK